MAELLSPGVYNEEIPSKETLILGVSTSNFATVGWLPRGEENKAILVTSLSDYFRKFGSYWKYSDVPLAVTAFFKNTGSRGYIVRVTPSDAVAAEATVPTNTFLVKAISKGAWGNLVRQVIKGNVNYYDYQTAVYSKFDIEIQEESVDGTADFEIVETFEAVDLTDEDAADYYPLVINDEDNGSNEIEVTKVNGGIPSAFNPTTVSNETIGTGTGSQETFTHTMAQTEVAPYTLQVKVNSVHIATDDGRGVFELQSGVSGYTAVSGTIDYATGVFAIHFTPAVPVSELVSADYIKKGVDSLSTDLVGGADGTSISRTEVTDPTLEADQKGLYALNTVDEILNIGLPDFSGDAVVQGDLLTYCSNRQDCFAILDTARGIDSQSAKKYKQITLNSLNDYGAIYWPGIKVADPLKGNKSRAISPVGHIAGVLARTDSTRNVGKAPAGVNEGRLDFATGLEFDPISKGDRDILYPINVNSLISSPQTGRCVWGARTLAITGDFTLVSTRRLFIFLRKSIYNFTQDLVFEPIGADLFTTVNLRISGFLGTLCQDGYFASRVPAESFRVICDESNNTQQTIAARQLITDILVADQKPAEFVRFRFQRALNKLA